MKGKIIIIYYSNQSSPTLRLRRMCWLCSLCRRV